MVEQRNTPSGSTRSGLATTFVGRNVELDELHAALREARGGRGGLISVCGDPGIGKTRLAGEAADSAGAHGFAVCWGRCWEGGGAPAYWPWQQVLRALARTADPSSASAAQALLDAVSEAGEAADTAPSASSGTAGDGDSTGRDSTEGRFALFERIAEFLHGAAARQPLLIIFDDLHAADAPSLLLLQFVAREIQSAPILLLSTYREAETRQAPKLAALLTRIGRWGRTLPLRGLSEIETAEILHAELVTQPSAELVHAIYAVTEGNPFFTDEIAHLLRAEVQAGVDIGAAQIRIPHAVRETIEQRLQPLLAQHRAILAAASVVGREFDLDRLMLAVGSGDAAVEAALASGERLGLLRKRGAKRFDFAHALIRETLYEALPLPQRCAAHRRLAEGLAQRATGEHSALLSDLAHHFAEAGEAVADQAIGYAERAGRAALQGFGYELAAEHFRRALDMQSRHRPRELSRRAQLLLLLGRSYARAWETPEARQVLLEAVELARAIARPDLLARAVIDIGALDLGVPRGSCDATLLALIDEALHALGPQDSPWRARLMGRMATELHDSPEVQRRDELTREAIAIAERCGDSATLAYVLSTRHFALWSTAPYAERLALAEAVIQHAARAGDRELTLQGHTWRVLDFIESGDAGLDQALKLYDQLAGELRQPRYLGMSCMLRGMRAQWQGNYGEAERLAHEALSLGDRVGDPRAFVNAHVLLFAVRRDQGRLAEIEPMAQAGAARFPDQPVARCFLGLVQAELGRCDEARQLLDSLGSAGFDDWRSTNQRGTLLGMLPAIIARCDARDIAERLQGLALRNSGTHLSQGPNAYFGPCDLQIGILAATLGQDREALQHFERAMEMSRQTGGRPWMARSLFEAARVLGKTADDQPRRETYLQQALQIAEALEMTTLAGEIRSEQRGLAAGAAQTGGKANGTAPAKHDATFRRDGDFWTVAYAGRVSRLRHSKGLGYLAELLRHPRRDLHVLELNWAVSGAPDDADRQRDVGALQQIGLHVDSGHSHELLFDARARDAYRARLETLRDQLEIAIELQDSDRSSQLQLEMNALAEELASGMGLGGRRRTRTSAAELVRQNVSRAIKSAINRIRRDNPELGLYLDATIKKGAFCSYNPDNRVAVRWLL